MIPSEAKVEWSKSPSGSVEKIEAKPSIQPFAWSPLRLTSFFPNEPNLDTTFIKEENEDSWLPLKVRLRVHIVWLKTVAAYYPVLAGLTGAFSPTAASINVKSDYEAS